MIRSSTSNQWCFKDGHIYKLITSTLEGKTTKWWQRWRRRLNTCSRLHSKGDHWLCQVQNTSDFPTELQFLLARGEIHVMTGLNKDKDKDKRSGEARVSDVFDCISLLLHIANICDGCGNCLWLVELLLFHANQVSNSFWVYNLASARWSVVYRNEHNEPGYWTKHQSVEPRPRWVKLLIFAIWDGS